MKTHYINQHGGTCMGRIVLGYDKCPLYNMQLMQTNRVQEGFHKILLLKACNMSFYDTNHANIYTYIPGPTYNDYVRLSALFVHGINKKSFYAKHRYSIN